MFSNSISPRRRQSLSFARIPTTITVMIFVLFLIALLEFDLVSCQSGGSDEDIRPPNIIFMLVDDLGWNDVSFHEGNEFKTPNIDSLAIGQGMVLSNYYVQPQCTPTRVALLSGRYPVRVGMQAGVVSPPSPYGLTLNVTVFPQDLKRAGYDTHIIGKWHLGMFDPAYLPTARGFDSFFGFYNGGQDYFLHNSSYEIDENPNDTITGFDLRDGNIPIMRPGEYSTYMYGERALEILDAYSQEPEPNPYFLFLSWQAVHVPLAAPEEYVDEFLTVLPDPYRVRMAAMMVVLDNVIGEITDAVKDHGDWNNTLLIFSTDNGGDQSDGGSSNWPLRGSKGTLWEGGTRGVAFVSGGWLPPYLHGTEMGSLMHVVDWYKTICAVAGVNATIGDEIPFDGMNFLPNILAEIPFPEYEPREMVLLNINPIECQTKTRLCGGLRYHNLKLLSVTASTGGLACRNTWCPMTSDPDASTVTCNERNGNLMYPNVTEWYAEGHCPYNGDPCLYDLDRDPCEYTDIARTNRRTVRQLLKYLQDYNDTQFMPYFLQYEVDVNGSDPMQFQGHFWQPWHHSEGFPTYVAPNITDVCKNITIELREVQSELDDLKRAINWTSTTTSVDDDDDDDDEYDEDDEEDDRDITAAHVVPDNNGAQHSWASDMMPLT